MARSLLTFGFLALIILCSASTVVLAQSAATAYLQSSLDRYQHTVDVYKDADAAGNHFAARGEFDSSGGVVQVPTMDEISTGVACHGGITCITASFNATGSNWGGWYFLNGVLGPSDRVPSSNWGTVPDAGFDLSGATALTVWARGKNGGERVQFIAFGVGWDPNSGAQLAPYPDSSRRITTGVVTLTTTWTQYQISLAGLDIHYVLGGFGWVAAATDQGNPFAPLVFYLDDIQYVKSRPSDRRFAVSYETQSSSLSFDSVERNAAFVYDNDVALIALTAAGDLERARYIADAILYGQTNDRFFSDNRVRNAYQGGDISLPPGWVPNNRLATIRMPGWYDVGRSTWFEDATQVSSNTGNIAWTILALLTIYDNTGYDAYLTGAQQLGTWVVQNASDSRGAGGFTGGYDGWENGAAAGGSGVCATGIFVNGQCKRLYKSSEHNVDLYAAFSRLYLADSNPAWASAAQQAKHFLLSMWDPAGGKFFTGTTEDGVTIDTTVLPTDIQTWALQALGSEAQAYVASLSYVETHSKTTLGYGFKQDGDNSCGDWTWFEGTAQMALGYLLVGNTAKAQSIMAGLHEAQNFTGSIDATDGSCLNTGFLLNDGTPWVYYPRAHLGATAWLSLAENGWNAFGANHYSPHMSPSALAFGSEVVGTPSGALILAFSNPGTAALPIAGIGITGPNASEFSILSNSCGTTLGMGQSCAIAVRFQPTDAGSRTAALTITGGLGVLTPVPLSGTGTLPTYTLTVSVLPLGSGMVLENPSSLAGSYSSGTQVCLTPQAATGWRFSSWSGETLDAQNCLVMTGDKSITANFVLAPLQFLPVTPCRIMDTRNPNGPLGGPYIAGGSARAIPAHSSACGIPANASAYSLNVTVVPRTGTLGFLTLWPTGLSQPLASTLNSLDGSILANAAIVPAGTGGSISAFASNDTDLIVDINGYFVPPTTGSLQFYPLTPCRVLDTRNPSGTFGGPSIVGNTSRSFPIPSSGCGAPSSASAYSFNVTVVPHGPLGYVTAWPTGVSQPLVSTVNSLDGTILANAAIVPAGTNGAVSFYASNTTDVVVDINGYFAPPGAGGLNFYTATPCRIVDTRNANGTFGGPIMSGGTTRIFSLPQGSCGLPTSAAAYSLNITVVPLGFLGYLSTWPTGASQPMVSTLNALKGQVVANAAIVPAGTSGAINVYVTNNTHMIIDTNGYFAQ